jgi:hypothetical protein
MVKVGQPSETVAFTELRELMDHRCYGAFHEMLMVSRDGATALNEYCSQAIAGFKSDCVPDDLLSKVMEMEKWFDSSAIGHRMR